MKIKTQSKKVNKAWVNNHVNDPYVKLAQKEGYRARAGKPDRGRAAYLPGRAALLELGRRRLGLSAAGVGHRARPASAGSTTAASSSFNGTFHSTVTAKPPRAMRRTDCAMRLHRLANRDFAR